MTGGPVRRLGQAAAASILACVVAAGCAPGGGSLARSTDRARLGRLASLASRAVAHGAQAVPGQAAGPRLRLVRTVPTSHGNAAGLAWSDDGKALFLANEEGWMSAVKIDAGDAARPRIAATEGTGNFLWAVAQRAGLLVFQPSLGDETLRLDPRSLAVVWRRRTGPSHAIATDGSRVYVAQEGTPGALVVLGADGRELGRVAEPDGWSRVYGAAYAAGGGLLCVAAAGDGAGGAPGGIYVYDVRGGRPIRRGRIPGPASAVAAGRGRAWVASGSTLAAWQLADPAHPQLAGTWQQPVEKGPGGTPVRLDLGSLAVDRAGTRVYAAYRSVAAQGGGDVPDWSAGFMIFDVARDAPELLVRQDWTFSAPYRLAPASVALSPDGATLAVSYWRYGVRLFGVAGDRVAGRGGVATAGEAHDVYVDAQGVLYVFANETMQIIDPRTGGHLADVPLAHGGDGGWKPFRDGAVVVRGQPVRVLSLRHAAVRVVQDLPDPGTYVWDSVYAEPYLYSGGENGALAVQRIDPGGPGTYSARIVGEARAPRADGAIGYAPLLAVAKDGPLVWALGPTVGVAVFDVRDPASPRLVMHDPFTFEANGNHAGLVAARGRVYAGAGSAGVIIYDPATLRRTGAIGGLSVDFLDTVGSDFLVVANYWYPRLPEGVYVYDLRRSPDAPAFVDRFPRPGGSANFRARVVGHRIYRVALSGIDILEGP